MSDTPPDAPVTYAVLKTVTGVGIEGTYDDPTGPAILDWVWPDLPAVGHRVRIDAGRWFRVLSLDWTIENPPPPLHGTEAKLVISITDDPE